MWASSCCKHIFGQQIGNHREEAPLCERPRHFPFPFNLSVGNCGDVKVTEECHGTHVQISTLTQLSVAVLADCLFKESIHMFLFLGDSQISGLRWRYTTSGRAPPCRQGSADIKQTKTNQNKPYATKPTLTNQNLIILPPSASLPGGEPFRSGCFEGSGGCIVVGHGGIAKQGLFEGRESVGVWGRLEAHCFSKTKRQMGGWKLLLFDS